MIHVSENAFTEAAMPIIRNIQFHRKAENLFRRFFGVSPAICSTLWKEADEFQEFTCLPVHLLWTLLFCKLYVIEDACARLANVDPKTFRTKIWLLLQKLSQLKIIRWEDRIVGNPLHNAFCSVDGVEFRISEPSPFDRRWFSHKFKGPGLRYEIALNINDPNVVWFNGPYPCGSYPDVKIFREKLKHFLLPEETVITDNGYFDKKCIRKISCLTEEQSAHKRIRASYETVNSRFKRFSILQNRFRHDLNKHHMVFASIAKLVQLEVALERPLFSF